MFRVIATVGLADGKWTRQVPTFYVDGGRDAGWAARQALSILQTVAGPDTVSIYLTACHVETGELDSAEYRRGE
jgi:fermentation-respiration switch protein FrsA (DUF1100 family)